MSRIGRKHIAIPAGVTVNVAEGNVVTVKGPKGELNGTFDKDLSIVIEGSEVVVDRPNDEAKFKSLHGLTRTLISNMVTGVSQGFTKTLEINGVGYRAQKNGKTLSLNLGYSHPVEFQDADGVEFEVPAPNKIIVKGIDKQKVGQVAAVVRSWRLPEPYLGKGIKYDYEVIRRKEGKSGAKGKK